MTEDWPTKQASTANHPSSPPKAWRCHLLSKEGFDPVYGARPLRRAIQQQIEDKLSEEMLEGKLVAGKNYVCRYSDDVFTFEEI